MLSRARRKRENKSDCGTLPNAEKSLWEAATGRLHRRSCEVRQLAFDTVSRVRISWSGGKPGALGVSGALSIKSENYSVSVHRSRSSPKDTRSVAMHPNSEGRANHGPALGADWRPW